MTTFDDREEAFEARFAHDEDLRFRANARRNHKLGLWAATLMRRDATEADTYAQNLVSAGVTSGDQAILAKLRKDFRLAGADQPNPEIRRTMERLLAEAVGEIMRD